MSSLTATWQASKHPQLIYHTSKMTPTLQSIHWLLCDGTDTETSFQLSVESTSPFILAGGDSSVHYWQLRCKHQLTAYEECRTTAFVLYPCGGYELLTPFPLHFPLFQVDLCHHVVIRLYRHVDSSFQNYYKSSTLWVTTICKNTIHVAMYRSHRWGVSPTLK
jgi:hypothetical protein